jgi:hypothetical protein
MQYKDLSRSKQMGEETQGKGVFPDNDSYPPPLLGFGSARYELSRSPVLKIGLLGKIYKRLQNPPNTADNLNRVSPASSHLLEVSFCRPPLSCCDPSIYYALAVLCENANCSKRESIAITCPYIRTVKLSRVKA